MNAVEDTAEPGSEAIGSGAADQARQIRGSALLLVGRLLAMVIGLATHVVIVRYLERQDYGAFSYALAMVTFGRILISLGHKRAVTRFVSIYEEKGQYDRLFGTLVLVFGSVAATSAIFLGTLALISGQVGGLVVDHPLAVPLLMVLILLAPVQALDDIFEGTFAVFARPQAIFFRKFLLTPIVRLVVVLALVLSASGVLFLAVGYVAAGVLGILLYVALLRRLLRTRGLSQRFRWSTLQLPYREFFGFSIPLLTHEVVHLSMTSISVIILGLFAAASDVAGVRAIYPAAMLNHLVVTQFALLFTPLASRLFARGDLAGMERAYWNSAAWVAVLTFPILAMTVPMAEPTTLLLFGEQYRDAGLYLAVLSLGIYASASIGFNALTLAVFGRVRYVVVVNVAAAVLNVVLSLVLIPRYGALGAASANTITLITQNVFNQWGLRRELGISVFDRHYLPVYVSIVVGLVFLALIALWLQPNIVLATAIAGATWAAVLLFSRRLLRVAETAPELLRIPFLRRLLA